MKVLVTGGTGFLGSYILRALIDQGYSDIVGIHRTESSFDLVEDIKPQISWIESDLFNLPALDGLIKDVDVIIHSAALVSLQKKDRNRLLQTNVHGTAQLVDLAIAHDVSRFVYVSSVAALGPERKDGFISEQSGWNGKPAYSNYAVSKYMAELEVFRGHAEGLSTAIINPSYIMGAGIWDAGPTSLCKQIYEGLSFYPKGTNGMVDVRDVAQMAVQLSKSRDIDGERIICSNENISHHDLFRRIAQGLNKKSPAFRMGPLIEFAALAFNQFQLIFSKGNELLTRESLRIASMDLAYDNSYSRNALNFKYRSLEETVEETCKSFLSTYTHGRKLGILPLKKIYNK